MRSIRCTRCKEQIEGIVYVREYDHERPYCYECVERENQYNDIWEHYYLSEYISQVEDDEYADYGDRESKRMRDEL